MADTVDTLTLFQGKERQVYRFTNISDGTGESNVAKIVKANLVNTLGVAPAKIIVTEMQWKIQGFSSVRINWDHTTPDECAVLTGVGFWVSEPEFPGLVDPASAGGTGNLTFTTAGAVANATYDITVKIRLTA